eukprot:scaffold142255_cov30-Tisochrysis_lutea.AAC.5
MAKAPRRLPPPWGEGAITRSGEGSGGAGTAARRMQRSDSVRPHPGCGGPGPALWTPVFLRQAVACLVYVSGGLATSRPNVRAGGAYVRDGEPDTTGRARDERAVRKGVEDALDLRAAGRRRRTRGGVMGISAGALGRLTPAPLGLHRTESSRVVKRKHEHSWPRGQPALKRVGVAWVYIPRDMRSYALSTACKSGAWTARATRISMCCGRSSGMPGAEVPSRYERACPALGGGDWRAPPSSQQMSRSCGRGAARRQPSRQASSSPGGET